MPARHPGRRPAALLDQRPIQARPTPSWERVVKWMRRRPAIAVLIGVSVAAAVALLAMGLAHNGRLRRERANADTQRDAARVAQARAEADFRLALDAAKRFYTEVSENKLLNVPTLDPLRIELLEAARDFYQRIAQERPEDADVQAELARAGWRLAVMVSDARSVAEGIRLLDQPIVIQERLVRQYPDRPEYQSDLARSYNNLGIMHRKNNQNDLGGQDWERALASGSDWYERIPTTSSTAATWARASSTWATGTATNVRPIGPRHRIAVPSRC